MDLTGPSDVNGLASYHVIYLIVLGLMFGHSQFYSLCNRNVNPASLFELFVHHMRNTQHDILSDNTSKQLFRFFKFVMPIVSLISYLSI
jgi:hypothetical protein